MQIRHQTNEGEAFEDALSTVISFLIYAIVWVSKAVDYNIKWKEFSI